MGPTLSNHYRWMTMSVDPEVFLSCFEHSQQWANNLTWDLTIFQPASHFLLKMMPDIVMFLKEFVLLSWGHCKSWHPKSPRNTTKCVPLILAACGGQGTKRFQESPADWGHWRWRDWIRGNVAGRISKELLFETTCDCFYLPQFYERSQNMCPFMSTYGSTHSAYSSGHILETTKADGNH